MRLEGSLSQSLGDLLSGLAIAVIVHSLDPSLSTQLIDGLIPAYGFVLHGFPFNPTLYVCTKSSLCQTTAVFQNISPMISVYPFAVGLAFFRPLDLSFSCWFFFVVHLAEFVIAAALGTRYFPAEIET